MKKLLVPKSAAHLLHKAHSPAHTIYFALVAVEAGKWYGAVAAILFLLAVADHLIRPREPHEVAVERRIEEGDL
jgi:hypothetical protein